MHYIECKIVNRSAGDLNGEMVIAYDLAGDGFRGTWEVSTGTPDDFELHFAFLEERSIFVGVGLKHLREDDEG